MTTCPYCGKDVRRNARFRSLSPHKPPTGQEHAIGQYGRPGYCVGGGYRGEYVQPAMRYRAPDGPAQALIEEGSA